MKAFRFLSDCIILADKRKKEITSERGESCCCSSNCDAETHGRASRSTDVLVRQKNKDDSAEEDFDPASVGS